MFLKGDVAVTGFVSSGAEILASGSIHIYGALRGRAIAGVLGDANARIFCQKFEAELVSIDGYYRTADDFDPALLGRAVQIRLINDALSITPLG
jgi:septum site-determining protein MinC